eukprot:s132_g30.t1
MVSYWDRVSVYGGGGNQPQYEASRWRPCQISGVGRCSGSLGIRRKSRSPKVNSDGGEGSSDLFRFVMLNDAEGRSF